jgi:hypothetical protein
MALATACQTPGAVYGTGISGRTVTFSVTLPFDPDLTEEEAALLEANGHNLLELLVSPLFTARQGGS